VWSRVEAIISDVLRKTTVADLLRMEESAMQRSLDDRARLSSLLQIDLRR
jgi:DNA-binding IscR family transcriptional regulator